MQQWLWRDKVGKGWRRFSPDGLTNATHMATNVFFVNVFFFLPLSRLVLSLTSSALFFSSPQKSETSNNSSHSSLVYFHPASFLLRFKEILLYFICIMEPVWSPLSEGVFLSLYLIYIYTFTASEVIILFFKWIISWKGYGHIFFSCPEIFIFLPTRINKYFKNVKVMANVQICLPKIFFSLDEMMEMDNLSWCVHLSTV